MTDHEKITTLRDALKECRDRADPFDGQIISAIANAALAMTADASEPAPDSAADASVQPKGGAEP